MNEHRVKTNSYSNNRNISKPITYLIWLFNRKKTSNLIPKWTKYFYKLLGQTVLSLNTTHLKRKRIQSTKRKMIVLWKWWNWRQNSGLKILWASSKECQFLAFQNQNKWVQQSKRLSSTRCSKLMGLKC